MRAHGKETAMRAAILLALPLCAVALCPLDGLAQSGEAADSASVAPPAVQPAAPKQPSKIYYGGSVTLTFGDVFRVGVQPMVGYKVNPKLSVGGKVGYEYLRDTRFNETFDSHNFGFSGFGRYHFVPQVYAHGEFAAINYDIQTSAGESEREWVPFLLLGGGYRQAISPRASAYVEVLFDVLQSDKSPYEDWDPMVSVGVGIGF